MSRLWIGVDLITASALAILAYEGLEAGPVNLAMSIEAGARVAVAAVLGLG